MNQNGPQAVDFLLVHGSFRWVCGNNAPMLQKQGQVLVPQWWDEPVPPGEEITIILDGWEFGATLLHSPPLLELDC